MGTQVLSEDEIRRRLAPLFDRPEVRLVVLFGSRAAGRGRPESDVDLGVIATGNVSELAVEAIRLLGTDRVDWVDLARATPLLAMAVAKGGRSLYEREPGAFASFVSLALRRYNDTAKLRKAREDGLRAFLSERGLCPP